MKTRCKNPMRQIFFTSPHADCARSKVQKSQHDLTSQRLGHTRLLLHFGSRWLGGWCRATTLCLELKQSLNEVIPAIGPVFLSSACLEDVLDCLFGAHRKRDECSNQRRCGAVDASIAVEENLDLVLRFRSVPRFPSNPLTIRVACILLFGFNKGTPN